MKIFVQLFLLLNVAVMTAQSGGQIDFEFLNDSTVVVYSELDSEPAYWYNVNEEYCNYRYEYYQYGEIDQLFSLQASCNNDTLVLPPHVSSIRARRVTNWFTNAGNFYKASNDIEIVPPLFVRDTITMYYVQEADSDAQVPDNAVNYCTVMYDTYPYLELSQMAESIVIMNSYGIPVLFEQYTNSMEIDLPNGFYYAYLTYGGGLYEIDSVVIN